MFWKSFDLALIEFWSSFDCGLNNSRPPVAQMLGGILQYGPQGFQFNSVPFISVQFSSFQFNSVQFNLVQFRMFPCCMSFAIRKRQRRRRELCRAGGGRQRSRRELSDGLPNVQKVFLFIDLWRFVDSYFSIYSLNAFPSRVEHG